MSEKPKRRLVHMQHYLVTLGKKSALYSSATVMVSSGTVLLLTALVLSWFSYRGWRNDLGGFGLILLNGGIAASGMAMLWAGTTLFTTAKKIEPGIPITKNNLQQLPASESLVRASEVPLDQHQTELLRVASYGNKTPSEELLRAIPTHRSDT